MPPPPTYPTCWLWLMLPFAGAGLITTRPVLCALIHERGRLTLGVGLAAFGAFCLAMLGVIGGWAAWPTVIVCGLLSGFACFYETRRDDDGGGDDAERDDAPPGDGIDWGDFDRTRARWVRRPDPDRPRAVV